MLSREFYLRDANSVAPELLGKLLIHETSEGIASGIIVEVESYIGPDDRGSHAYLNKRTPRTEIQFGNGGYAYIYRIYGMYNCFCVVTNTVNRPEVVLVRALEPHQGVELMQKRRAVNKITDLCNGPGKLCSALGITSSQYGEDLCSASLYLMDHSFIPTSRIVISPRVNIDYAGSCKNYLWRYYIKDNPYVSRVQKRYFSDITLNNLENK